MSITTTDVGRGTQTLVNNRDRVSIVPIPASPQLLVTTANITLHDHRDPRQEAPTLHPHLGRLLQPRHTTGADNSSRAGLTWAADNDCFQRLDEPAYRTMLAKLSETPAGCRFVTAPDIVADAVATAARFKIWQPIIREYGLPVALVLQDGQENVPVPWDDLEAVFIGGSDDFKLGPLAADLAQEAKGHGKWVHWGRVNTRTRIRYCVATGACDSLDGSGWAKWRKSNLSKGLEWVRDAVEDHARAGFAADARHDMECCRVRDIAARRGQRLIG